MTQIPDSRVPIVRSISEIYGQDASESHQARFDTVIQMFKHCFHSTQQPQFVARAPGRVNLIGEHIDYSGYGVLPMALDVDSMVVCSVQYEQQQQQQHGEEEAPSSSVVELKVHVANVDDLKFPEKTHCYSLVLSSSADQMDSVTTVGQYVTIDKENHHWSNYVLSGVRGALTRVQLSELMQRFDTATKADGQRRRIAHIYLMVSGTVPMGSGLSSSSALVCSCTLATCALFGANDRITKQEFGQLAADSERFGMNVQIGGMDQAISFLGEKNRAQYITFEPVLNHQSVTLPSHVSFVVSNTLVGAHKNESAAHNYNRRVIECRLATALLAKHLLKTVLSEYHTLHWLQENLSPTDDSSLSAMIGYCQQHLTSDEYSLQDVANELNLGSVDEVRERYFGSIVLANEQCFKLRQRSVHVFSEAKRVLDAVSLLSNLETASDETQATAAQQFGQLMNESHQSCKDLFECSCTELDELTSFARSRNGCLGSRLTGAGWGGCCVSLVRHSDLRQFLDDVWQFYYEGDRGHASDVIREQVLFSSSPSSGAVIIQL